MSWEQEIWDLNSPPIWLGSLKTRTPTPVLTAKFTGRWAFAHIGPVSQRHREARLTADQQNPRSWSFLQDLTHLPSLALFCWGTKQDDPTPSPLKRLLLHILFNLAPYPNSLTTFLLDSLDSWIRTFERSLNKLYLKLSSTLPSTGIPDQTFAPSEWVSFPPNVVFSSVNWW